jgi:hypothetical protein
MARAESYALTFYTSNEEFEDRSATRGVEAGTWADAQVEIGRFVRDYSAFVAARPDTRRLIVTMDRIPCPTCGR